MCSDWNIFEQHTIHMFWVCKRVFKMGTMFKNMKYILNLKKN